MIHIGLRNAKAYLIDGLQFMPVLFIIADSEALLEYQESLDKIGVLMQALEARFGEA